jgi:hypothetical protein
VVVEHLRSVEQVLRHRESSVGVVREQHTLGERGGGLEVNRLYLVLRGQGGEP